MVLHVGQVPMLVYIYLIPGGYNFCEDSLKGDLILRNTFQSAGFYRYRGFAKTWEIPVI